MMTRNQTGCRAATCWRCASNPRGSRYRDQRANRTKMNAALRDSRCIQGPHQQEQLAFGFGPLSVGGQNRGRALKFRLFSSRRNLAWLQLGFVRTHARTHTRTQKGSASPWPSILPFRAYYATHKPDVCLCGNQSNVFLRKQIREEKLALFRIEEEKGAVFNKCKQSDKRVSYQLRRSLSRSLFATKTFLSEDFFLPRLGNALLAGPLRGRGRGRGPRIQGRDTCRRTPVPIGGRRKIFLLRRKMFAVLCDRTPHAKSRNARHSNANSGGRLRGGGDPLRKITCLPLHS